MDDAEPVIDAEYVRRLEAANEELRRTNRELARGLLGKHDAAAAATRAKYQRLTDEHWILSQEVAELRAERDQTRYKVADALRDGIRGIPGIGHVWRALGRLLSRRS